MLVMTVIGVDRPGLVEGLAELVAEHGGNWLESRMSHLGGHFAGILRVEAPEDRVPSLTEALKGLASRGLTVVVHQDRAEPGLPGGGLRTLEIVGQDRPGIVRQISRALARYRINVEELHTECASAAMSGETLFRARARLSIPEGCDTNALRRELETIAADLIVDVSWAEASPTGG